LHAALSRAQSALAIAPDSPDGLYLQARALEGLERPEEALDSIEKALLHSSQPAPLHLQRVRLLRSARGLAAALEALQTQVENNPQEPQFLVLQTECLLEAGQGEAAILAASQALQSAGERLTVEQCARLHQLIGRHMRLSGQLDNAVHHLSEAVRLTPGDIEAYLELGRTHQERRQYAQAIAVLRQAIQIAPTDARPYYQAGVALKENKDYEGAESMLRRAAQYSPTDLSIHRLLGAVVALNLVHNRRQTNTEREML
jgi:tetratricopeptide (TPR) repeat protein